MTLALDVERLVHMAERGSPKALLAELRALPWDRFEPGAHLAASWNASTLSIGLLPDQERDVRDVAFDRLGARVALVRAVFGLFYVEKSGRAALAQPGDDLARCASACAFVLDERFAWPLHWALGTRWVRTYESWSAALRAGVVTNAELRARFEGGGDA